VAVVLGQELLMDNQTQAQVVLEVAVLEKMAMP
jgi:hypothetical protein